MKQRRLKNESVRTSPHDIASFSRGTWFVVKRRNYMGEELGSITGSQVMGQTRLDGYKIRAATVGPFN